MNNETLFRARTIVKRGEVKEAEDSVPPFYHFLVKQRTGEWTDVWYNPGPVKEMEWSCNARREFKDKNGRPDSYGCVMYKGDKRKPYCSHTLACEILLKQKK
jgi:hypothetical protein